MNERKVTAWLAVLTLTLVIQPGNANPVQVLENGAEDLYREHFINDEKLPDHFAYMTLMHQLYLDALKSESQPNIEKIQDQFKVNEAEATNILRLLLVSYQGVLASNRSVTSRILCSPSKSYIQSRQGPDKSYDVLDTLDDIKDTNLRKQYDAARYHLSQSNPEVTSGLDNWLTELKPDSQHRKFDHRVIYEQAEQDVSEVIATACNLLAANPETSPWKAIGD